MRVDRLAGDGKVAQEEQDIDLVCRWQGMVRFLWSRRDGETEMLGLWSAGRRRRHRGRLSSSSRRRSEEQARHDFAQTREVDAIRVL